MARRITLICMVFTITLVVACGPDTIFLRPSLDTPAHHVQNGHSLLARGKIDAADAEFSMAKSLDDGYAPAYVGLALVQGYRGDVRGGLATLDQARAFAVTPEDMNAVNDGYERLKKIQSTSDQ